MEVGIAQHRESASMDKNALGIILDTSAVAISHTLHANDAASRNESLLLVKSDELSIFIFLLRDKFARARYAVVEIAEGLR